MAGSPRFPGEPSCPSALFSDPGRTRTPGPYGVSTRPPRLTTTKAPDDYPVSGLNHTALVLAVYASQRRSPVPTQDSLPAAGQALPGGIGYPQGFMKGF